MDPIIQQEMDLDFYAYTELYEMNRTVRRKHRPDATMPGKI